MSLWEVRLRTNAHHFLRCQTENAVEKAKDPKKLKKEIGL